MVVLVTQRVPGEAVAEGVDDGGVGGLGVEHRVAGGIEGQGGRGLVEVPLLALIGELMVESSQGEATGAD